MSKVFTRSFRVRWSEINAEGHVDITSYLRYLIETACDWAAAGGLSMAESHALGLVWVMRETQFEFFRPLRFDDRFEFTIWVLQWRQVRGTRAFELRLQDGGEVVAQGAQQIVVLDGETMRPKSPPAALIDYYHLEEPRIMPIERFPRAFAPPETAYVLERRVEARDVDAVRIIDNSVFGAYAEEAAARALAAAGWPPAELAARELVVSARRFHILHQTPAVWGDRLALSVWLRALDETGGEWAIAVQRPDDGAEIASCTLRWTLADRRSGEARRLPASLASALGEWNG